MYLKIKIKKYLNRNIPFCLYRIESLFLSFYTVKKNVATSLVLFCEVNKKFLNNADKRSQLKGY